VEPPVAVVERPAEARREEACAAGQVRNDDTSGHCCWPGQVWLASRGECAGAPRCPSGLERVGDDCLAACGVNERREGASCVCAAGMAQGVDTRGHCCWPGQFWVPSRSACGGVPSACPGGLRAEGERCVQPVVCPAGTVLIAGGDFAMGDGSEYSMAPRTVHVNTFCMDRTEVSVDAYRACVRSGGCATEPTPHRNVRGDGNLVCNWNRPNAESHPVNCVDWQQATTYCSSVGGRLPTEQEWEYAARGREGRVYAWGNAAPTGALANFCGDECASYAASSGFNGWTAYPGHHDEYAFTAPVDSMTAGATPDGLLHMTGNVWEWTSTVDGNNRVYRGGGWNANGPSWVRAASRFTPVPAFRSYDFGFRCARGVM